MNQQLHSYLTTPIPRAQGLLGVGIALTGTVYIYAFAKGFQSEAKKIFADQQERLRIYSETTEFLMGRADDATLSELNKKLDYWRVVRGMPVEAEEEK